VVIGRLDAYLESLLDDVWPGIGARIGLAASLGFPWADISTAFVRLEGRRPIAHVGLIEIPMVIAGGRRAVGGVHAVCTDPGRRGQGHCRALMEDALAACRGRYETLVLYTAIPELYARFGFRRVAEHRFVRRLGAPASAAGPAPRRLSGESTGDVALLRRLLASRAPVSSRLGVLGPPALFVLAEVFATGGLARLHYHEDLDVVTVHEIAGGTLRLLDVVGASIPPLSALLERVGAGVDTVVCEFVPDALGGGFEAEPAGQGDLMVRGELAVEGTPFAVPPLARC